MPKEATVYKMLDKDNLRRLLTMNRVPNEGQMRILYPFSHKLAEVPKAQCLGALVSSIQAAMIAKEHHRLSFPTSAGLLNNLTTLQWNRIHDDLLATGLLGPWKPLSVWRFRRSATRGHQLTGQPSRIETRRHEQNRRGCGIGIAVAEDGHEPPHQKQ